MAIFVKKSFFFRLKKNFDGNFFLEITKKNKKWLYQMKVGIELGKVKKFGIGWCIPHRMAADNAPASNRVKEVSPFFCQVSMQKSIQIWISTNKKAKKFRMLLVKNCQLLSIPKHINGNTKRLCGLCYGLPKRYIFRLGGPIQFSNTWSWIAMIKNIYLYLISFLLP